MTEAALGCGSQLAIPFEQVAELVFFDEPLGRRELCLAALGFPRRPLDLLARRPGLDVLVAAEMVVDGRAPDLETILEGDRREIEELDLKDG